MDHCIFQKKKAGSGDGLDITGGRCLQLIKLPG